MNHIFEILIGIISGAISGLGMGGGTVLIMLMSYFFDYTQQMLQSINLLYYIPTTLVAGLVYAKNKYIDYKVGVVVIITALIGAYIGSKIAVNIDNNLLRKFFATYLVAIGIIFLLKKPQKA